MAMNPRLLRPLATGFSPSKIAGLQLWLDASDQSTMTLNGTTVQEWRSKAGTIALTQGTAGAQPTLTANYVNGRSALTFDGGDAMFSAAAPLQIAACTSFLVFDETTAINFAGLLAGTPSSDDDFSSTSAFITSSRDTSQNIVRASNVGAAAGIAMSASSSDQGATAYGRKLASAIVAASTASMRVNAVPGVADTAHTASGSSTGTLVGGRFISGAVSASFRFNGRICEILHYSQELSLAQIQTVERYLSQRWGITL